MPQGREFAAGLAQIEARQRSRVDGARSRLGLDAGLSALGPQRLPAAGLCAALLVSAAAAWADDPTVPAQYRLETPSSAAALTPKLPGVTDLGEGQEFLFRTPSSLRLDSGAGNRRDDWGAPLDRARATYRYTWYSSSSWDFKIGLSTALDQSAPWQRLLMPTSSDHLHVGPLPTMHLESEGRLSDRWLLSVSAEGLHTPRGQGLDMDLRVDYGLTRSVSLFGSYRLTDSSGEGSEVYGFLPSNSAQFGVRMRF